MFDIGFTELLLIGVVALIVLGPERLPKAARFAGLWVRRARAQWYSVKSELERDLAAEELRRSVREAQQSLHGIGEELQQTDAHVRRELDALQHDADALQRDVRQATQLPHEQDPYAIAMDPTRGTRADHHADDAHEMAATDSDEVDWHALMAESDTDEPNAAADGIAQQQTPTHPDLFQLEAPPSSEQNSAHAEQDRHANG